MKRTIILLFSFAVILVGCGDNAGSPELSRHFNADYAMPDGGAARVAFDYPEGWVVADSSFMNAIIIASEESLVELEDLRTLEERDPLESGQTFAFLLFTVNDTLRVQLGEYFTPLAVLGLLLQDGGVAFITGKEDPRDLRIGGANAAQATGDNGLVIALDLGPGVLVLTALTAPGEVDRFLSTYQDIVDSAGMSLAQ
jgi:hypothetical protein